MAYTYDFFIRVLQRILPFDSFSLLYSRPRCNASSQRSKQQIRKKKLLQILLSVSFGGHPKKMPVPFSS